MTLFQDVFFRNHPEPMWIYDLETLRFLEVNASAVRHYGYSEDEFLSMTIADIRPAEDVDALRRNVAEVSGGRDEAGTWRHVKKDGTLIHVRITSFYIDVDGRGAEIVAVADISDLVNARDAAERALAQNQAFREAAETAADQVKILLDAVPAKVAVLTAGDFRVIAASEAYLKTTKFTRDDVVGKALPDILHALGGAPAGIAKQQLVASLLRVTHTLATDLMPIQYFPFSDDVAHPRYWSASNTPVRDRAGKLAYIIHQLEDVTDLVMESGVDKLDAGATSFMQAPHLLPALLKSNELKAANLRLQEQEANLRTAQHLLGIGIWRMALEAEGAYRITWSDNTYDIYGVLPEEFGHNFDGYVRLVHPDDRKLMMNNFLAFQRSDEPVFRFEHRVKKRDGSVAYVEGRGEVTQTPSGRIITGVVRDVTHQVVQTAQMKLLSESIARVNDIVLITEAEPLDDPDGPKIVYANEAFERLTGYTREEAIGRTPRILQGPQTQRAELLRIRQALKKWEPVRAELINYRKDGEPFWIELDIVPLATEAGWYTHWIAVERDISHRKHLDQVRETESERFDLIMQATHVVIWDWTFKDETLWWNRNLSILLGYGDKNVQLAREYWADHIHPDDRTRVLASLEAFRQSSDLHWSQDYRLMRIDNSVRWVTDRAIMQRDRDGSPIRMVGSILDFTDRQNLEDRLRQAEKLESLGQLTGGIAHDFNNLLTVLLGNSETLSTRLPAGPLKEMAELSLAACESGASLVARLLAFARRQPLDPSFADLNECLEATSVLLRRALPGSIELQFEPGADLGMTHVDIVQFETAILNLCLNAKDAMPGGGRITIATANLESESESAGGLPEGQPRDCVMVEVRDNGAGMDAATLARAFEPFFTTKPSAQGSGLGLSMVYGFLKQSGGHVSIDSSPGAGTRVKLFFPRARDGEVYVRQLELEHDADLPELTVLVVEDNAFVMAHAKRMLADLGMTVITATTGQEALEMLSAHPGIDLLFTDVILPGGMDGAQIAVEARRARPDLKVLYTTGYADNALVHEGQADPQIVLLSKPYKQSDLAGKIIEAMGQELG